MNKWQKLNQNQSGQAALEAAIILIAFVVVASVFAFAVLSAGTASTEKGQQAIYAGLEGVQSSMEIKGAVIALGTSATGKVTDVIFTVALVAGGDPINLDDAEATRVLVIAYRDGVQQLNKRPITSILIVSGESPADALLEDGELAEIAVHVGADLGALDPASSLTANTAFTLEVKPPTGAVIALNRTTPAALEPVMELR